VLITHLLEAWTRPPELTNLFRGAGSKHLFQKWCAKHKSDFEVHTWIDKNDSVRGKFESTKDLRQTFLADQPTDDDGSEVVGFFTEPDALIHQTGPYGYGAATPSCDPLLSRPKTPPTEITSLGRSSGGDSHDYVDACIRLGGREMPPRPPLPPPMPPGLPPPPMPPHHRVLPIPPAMPVPFAPERAKPPVMPPPPPPKRVKSCDKEQWRWLGCMNLLWLFFFVK
jgi:hypothetical protein